MHQTSWNLPLEATQKPTTNSWTLTSQFGSHQLLLSFQATPPVHMPDPRDPCPCKQGTSSGWPHPEQHWTSENSLPHPGAGPGLESPNVGILMRHRNCTQSAGPPPTHLEIFHLPKVKYFTSLKWNISAKKIWSTMVSGRGWIQGWTSCTEGCLASSLSYLLSWKPAVTIYLVVSVCACALPAYGVSYRFWSKM